MTKGFFETSGRRHEVLTGTHLWLMHCRPGSPRLGKSLSSCATARKYDGVYFLFQNCFECLDVVSQAGEITMARRDASVLQQINYILRRELAGYEHCVEPAGLPANDFRLPSRETQFESRTVAARPSRCGRGLKSQGRTEF
jgi:hypothetical protein